MKQEFGTSIFLKHMAGQMDNEQFSKLSVANQSTPPWLQNSKKVQHSVYQMIQK